MEIRNRNVASAAKQAALTALGARLRAARTSAGVTQQTVAQLLQVTPQTVRNWEAGRHEPTEQTIDDLAAAYGISLEHLRGQTLAGFPGDFPPHPNQRVSINPHLLRDTRGASGFSQVEAARESGIGLSSIRRYERGTAMPTGATVRKLTLICGKPLFWLISSEGDDMPAEEDSYMDEPMRAYAPAKPDLGRSSVRAIADFILFTHRQQIKRKREHDACASSKQMAS